jgi:hypothetical protein
MGAATVSEKDALLGLLAGWCAKAKEFRDAHENARIRLRRWHYLLGVPAIVLSSAVAMTVFATMQRSVSTEIAVIVGVLSVGAAILAACQTFLRVSDRAEAHRQAVAEYERIADRAELGAALYGSGSLEEGRLEELREACRDVQEQIARVASTRPELGEGDRRSRARLPAADTAILPPRDASAPHETAVRKGGTAASTPPPGGRGDDGQRQPAPSSLPPPVASSTPGSIPPPARLPLGTLPPVRAPQPRGQSSAPPPVDRYERRSSQAPAAPEEGTAHKPR